jgi:IS30 family transposase
VCLVTRRRSREHLSAAGREEVSRGIGVGPSARAIACLVGRPTSTVSREIARNAGRHRRPKPSVLADNGALLAEVRGRLEEDGSPQQMAFWLKRTYAANASMRVSHETIYRSIYVGGRMELGSRAARHLRPGRSLHQVRMVKNSQGLGRIRNMVSIRSRPATVTDRVELGHWDGDLVMGRRPLAIATLVERSTRYLRAIPLPGYKADGDCRAIVADFVELPAAMRRSLTWDGGREAAEEILPWVRLGQLFVRARAITTSGETVAITSTIYDRSILAELKQMEDRRQVVPFASHLDAFDAQVQQVASSVTSAATTEVTVTLSRRQGQGSSSMPRMTVNGVSPDELVTRSLSDGMLGTTLLPQDRMMSLTRPVNPLEPLFGLGLPERSIRPLAQVLLTETLIRNQHASAVEPVVLGPDHQGSRQLKLTWLPPRPHGNSPASTPITIAGPLRGL